MPDAHFSLKDLQVILMALYQPGFPYNDDEEAALMERADELHDELVAALGVSRFQTLERSVTLQFGPDGEE